LLMSEGVMKGRITPQQFVALTATNVARLYGLSPRKGSIAIGADADADADLVIWDPERTVRIAQAMLHHATDYTPYEGMSVSAWPDTVLSRGAVVVENGQPAADLAAGRGEFLRCERPDAAAPRDFVPGIEARVAGMPS
jgi:dihydropyrimidinase